MEGFEVPVHGALTKQIMLAGVPREIAIINGTLTAAMVLGMHSWVGIPVGLGLHVLAAAMAKRDPQFFEIFKRQIKQKKYYTD